MDLAIGDELTPGYDPKALNAKHQSGALTKALDEMTVSCARKGASITIKNKGNLLHQLQQFSLPAYDRIFLFYGDNDYLYSKAGLKMIARNLKRAIHIIHHRNRWMKIYGILPLPMYGKTEYDKNTQRLTEKRGVAGYTLHDLIQWLSLIYSNYDVPTLNWSLLANPVVNQHNYQDRLVNGHYPKLRTYQLMAERIGDFVKKTDEVDKNRPKIPVLKRAFRHPMKPRWSHESLHAKPIIGFGDPNVLKQRQDTNKSKSFKLKKH